MSEIQEPPPLDKMAQEAWERLEKDMGRALTRRFWTPPPGYVPPPPPAPLTHAQRFWMCFRYNAGLVRWWLARPLRRLSLRVDGR